MELVQVIKDSGIVGAGGAGFPSHVKLSAKAEYVILNGAECEPLLRVDQQLIEIFADEIITGLEYIVKSTDAKKAYIAIKGKHKEAVDVIRKKTKNNNNIELFVLGDFYPAGDEQVLVNEVTKRVVPEVSIPLKVGCIVINVETVLNIVNALNGKPVTHTYLTVAGKVPKPVTLRIPIGISVREVLKLSGVSDFEKIKVIDGGPMMGKILQNIDNPITKTSKGLIVLDEDDYLIKRKGMTAQMALRQSKAGCLQCRMCTELCPRYLLGHNLQPHLMMRKSNYDRGEDIQGAEMASLCCECAACELYACPAGLSPRLININYKQEMAKKSVKYKPSKENFVALEVREYRKIPVKRLISRLGLKDYDVPAPLVEIDFKPKTVNIPLKMHIGVPSSPIVEVGQIVSEGELIAEIPEKALGARVHSSISGKVININDYITIESI